MKQGWSQLRIETTSLLRRQQGTTALETMLVVAVVVAVMAVTLAVGVRQIIPQVAGLVCPSVDTAADPAPTTGSCLGEPPPPAPGP